MTTTRWAISATTPRLCVIRMMAAPVLDLSWRMMSRICACTVTSRAVVGSSAISSLGSQASAMAIMTRWRMPPDSSCGYCLRRWAGLGDADQAQHLDRARFGRRAVEALMQRERLGDLPADREHRVERRHRLLEDHRDVVAADVAHLALGQRRADRVPWKRIVPSTMRPGGEAIRRMIDSDVTLLPQPDSPTTASVSPGATENETPSTARTMPSRVKKCVLRPSISSRGAASACVPLTCCARGAGRARRAIRRPAC